MRNHLRPVPVENIEQLAAALGDRDGLRRQDARRRLVAIGRPAVPALVEALHHRKDQVRWEAAKALADIADAESAPALVEALEDEDFGVRWLAAEGLIHMGLAGVPAILHALIARPGSGLLREGAHHVFKVLMAKGYGDVAGPMVTALESIGPEATVPAAALRAFESLEAHSARRQRGPHFARRAA